MQKIEHPTTGKLTVPAYRVRLDGNRRQALAIARQHNAEILASGSASAFRGTTLRAEGIV
jgi:hypothetical protein